MIQTVSLFEEPKNTPILGFFGEYRFLSNYHLCSCFVSGIEFISSEHAYMYQKNNDPYWQQKIINAKTPREAKLIGNICPLRPNWSIFRKEAMLIALKAKFKNEKELKMLLSTGDAYLEETNTWGDTYWGVCNGVGENNLGKLLMRIRSYL